MPVRKQDALDYHALPVPGKLSIAPTKPFETQLDLSFAYSPGVAEACLEIARDPELVWKYTSRSNLVAVGLRSPGHRQHGGHHGARCPRGPAPHPCHPCWRLRPAKGLADRIYDLSTHSTINREISARMSAACVSRRW